MSPRKAITPDAPGTVLLRDDSTRQWLLFEHPTGILLANRQNEVLPLLEKIDAAAMRGLHAAGFIAYEAAPAFDAAFRTIAPHPNRPLAWFGLYESPRAFALPDPPILPPGASWIPDITREDYHAAIKRIRSYIAAGDTYQVNYTFRLHARLDEKAWPLFLRLQHAQRAPYGAYLNIGDAVICSASPELFFDLSGPDILCRPMKGTAPRGCCIEDDDASCETLRASAKNRAENVMIVDMIRNDLGRVAVPGSVEVVSLFDVERFPTVWQMTSTIRAKTSAPVHEILRALFPCASITGAPKVRTMEIIAELETAPRGIYTGCIGYVAPNRRAQFSVAIRTVQLAPPQQDAEYGTGGGIVWDSTVESEYDECLIKSAILREQPQPFQLLETLLWQPDAGFLFEDLHLRRILGSARFFSFALEEQSIRSRLLDTAATFPDVPMRVRLLGAEDGTLTIETGSADGRFNMQRDNTDAQPWSIALATAPVSSTHRFLYHKTTRRGVYEEARRAFPDADDVILRNEREEITESTVANIVVLLDGEWYTPPVACGLLGGVFRTHLLQQKAIHERILHEADLRRADALYLINSVRGWIPASIRFCTTCITPHTTPD